MLEEVCARVHHMERAKASAHMDASSLQHGVDMCGIRVTAGLVVEERVAWLSRNHEICSS